MKRDDDEIREPMVAYGEAMAEPGSERIQRLVESGRLRPAKLDLLRLGSPPPAPHEMSLSQALAELRSEQ